MLERAAEIHAQQRQQELEALSQLISGAVTQAVVQVVSKIPVLRLK